MPRCKQSANSALPRSSSHPCARRRRRRPRRTAPPIPARVTPLKSPSAEVFLHASVLLNRMPIIGHCRKTSLNFLSTHQGLFAQPGHEANVNPRSYSSVTRFPSGSYPSERLSTTRGQGQRGDRVRIHGEEGIGQEGSSSDPRPPVSISVSTSCVGSPLLYPCGCCGKRWRSDPARPASTRCTSPRQTWLPPAWCT